MRRTQKIFLLVLFVPFSFIHRFRRFTGITNFLHALHTRKVPTIPKSQNIKQYQLVPHLKMSASSSSRRKPAIIVFDLDYTLWPFWVDTHVTPPFRKSNGHVLDAHGSKVKHYPEVPDILKNLTENGYEIGVASRTSEIDGAESLLHLFDWNQYISYKQIFPGIKVNHFINIKKDSGVDYSEMLFFDDEQRNISDTQRIGVTSILVKSGITQEAVDEGLEEFANKD